MYPSSKGMGSHRFGTEYQKGKNMEDKTQKYRHQIAPKIKEIVKICNENEIPFFMSFGVKDDKNGQMQLETTTLLPEMFPDCNDVKDSVMSDFVNLTTRNFTTKLKSKETKSLEMEADTFDPNMF
jgi:hypothetical protein